MPLQFDLNTLMGALTRLTFFSVLGLITILWTEAVFDPFKV